MNGEIGEALHRYLQSAVVLFSIRNSNTWQEERYYIALPPR